MARGKSMVKEIPDSVVESTAESVEIKEEKQPRKFAQSDLILCYSVTPGWLGVPGKSGQYYTFMDAGDECEIEYQDLFALKAQHSRYIYDPLFVIDDDELLENPRWKDIKAFYADSVYGKDDVNQVLNLPVNAFENALKTLPKGLKKAICVEAAKRIEDGSFDSLTKIKAIDKECGTDFYSILE